MRKAVSWSEKQNARRCQLIDREIDGALSDDVRAELMSLTDQLREYRRLHAPIPMEGALKLHAELLEKRRRREECSSDG